MTDTIAEIRARHEAQSRPMQYRGPEDADHIINVARFAHADRAALLARVAELEAKEAKDFEALAGLVGAASFVAGSLDSGITVGPEALASLKKAIEDVVNARTRKDTP